jgi:uncharacterized protein
MAKYRILSLDGGGSWCLIQVKCLRQLFSDTFGKQDPPGREVLGYFDLVVANSGGSLVAAAMAENYRLSEIEQIFHSEGVRKSIFSRLSIWERSLLNTLSRIVNLGPKYATVRKIAALEKILPGINALKLHHLPAYIDPDSPTHFVLVAYDYYRNRAELFRSDQNSRALSSVIERRVLSGNPAVSGIDELTMLQAVHASSTAPVNFFNVPANFKVRGVERYFWDGAITGNNNPVLIGATEAWANGHNAGDIQILSLGSGGTLFPATDQYAYRYKVLQARKEDPGLISDIKKMATSIINDPPDFATFVAYTMLYPGLPARSVNFIRLNPQLRPRLVPVNGVPVWDLPKGLNAEEFAALKNLNFDAVEKKEVDLIEKFCDQWLKGNVPNQAIRNDFTLERVLGHNSYQQGMEDFRKWNQVIA